MKADRDGYVRFTDVEKIGLGCLVLGAGRKKSSDPIYFSAGIEVFVKDGQQVKAGDILFKSCASDMNKISEAENFFKTSLEISEQSHRPEALIAETLSGSVAKVAP